MSLPDDSVLKTLRIRRDTFEAMSEFSAMEKRPFDALVQEALELWLDAKHKELLAKDLANENAQTNLSYDEFWDGVEL